MLVRWFDHKTRKPDPDQKFIIIDYQEKSSICNATFKNYFKNAYATILINPGLLTTIATIVNRKDLLSVIKRKIPKDPNMQKGRYGEVLSSKIVEEFHDYSVPVPKLRYLMSSGQSLPGTDLIAIKRNDSKLTEVCYIESKLRDSKTPTAPVEGYKQLMKDQDGDINELIFFVMACLYPSDKKLLQLFTNYFGNHDSSIDSFRVISIFDKNKWNEKSIDLLKNEITQTRHKITFDVVQIENLGKNISEFYNEFK